jgi:hypothetical protein
VLRYKKIEISEETDNKKKKQRKRKRKKNENEKRFSLELRSRINTHRMTSTNNNNNNDYDSDLYEIRLGGCNHKYIWSTRQLVTDSVESRFDVASGVKQDYYYCDRCAQPSKYRHAAAGAGVDANDDFCRRSVLHPVAFARKLSPIEKRRVGLRV